jgi:hypothetical protein
VAGVHSRRLCGGVTKHLINTCVHEVRVLGEKSQQFLRFMPFKPSKETVQSSQGSLG